MRLSSSFIFLVATAISGTYGSSDVSIVQTDATISTRKGTENTRHLEQLQAILGTTDLTDANALCGLMPLLAMMSLGSTATCNDDKTEATYAMPPDPSEVCDASGEFCLKDTSDTYLIPLPLDEDLTDTEIGVKSCVTYTKAPGDGFSLFLDEKACVTVEGIADVTPFFVGGELDGDFNATSCTATVADEDCSCSICENDEFTLSCPSIGIKSEGGCISRDSDVFRFSSFEPTEPLEGGNNGGSAAGVVLPSIFLSITLTFAALFV